MSQAIQAVAGSSIGAEGTSFRQVRLSDGTAVTLRPIRQTDLAALQEFFHRLSPESRYLRFHAHVAELSDEAWRALVATDGKNQVAILAWIGPIVVGVGRFFRLEHASDKAEVAFAVADAFQRRGIGGLLLGELLAAAARLNIESFLVHVMSENRGMRGLLRSRSLLKECSEAHGVIEVSLGR